MGVTESQFPPLTVVAAAVKLSVLPLPATCTVCATGLEPPGIYVKPTEFVLTDSVPEVTWSVMGSTVLGAPVPEGVMLTIPV